MIETSVTVDAFRSLCGQVERETSALDDDGKLPLEKLLNAGQSFFATRALLESDNRKLMSIIRNQEIMAPLYSS